MPSPPGIVEPACVPPAENASALSRTLTYLSEVIRRHRATINSTWRRLNPGRQALLVLAYLRKGETFAEIAARFGIGTATAWRYVREAIALLAQRSPTLDQALRTAKRTGYAFVVLDGTLIPSTKWPPTGPTTPANTRCTA